MSFVELPTELLLEIAVYVVLNDANHVRLCRLSQTCRRLYDIFIPQILVYHHNSIVSTRLLEDWLLKDGDCFREPAKLGNRNPLEGCFERITFMVDSGTTHDDIRCVRSLTLRASQIDAIIMRVDGRVNGHVLISFLNSCVHRSNLDLDLDEVYPFSFEGGPFIFRFESESKPVELQRHEIPSSWTRISRWLSNIRSFFGTSKPGHSCSFKPDDPDPPESHPSLSFTVIPRRPKFQAPLPQSKPQLATLHITGDTLFSASSYPWTLHILNSAPLTTLTITRITLTLFDWSQILPSLTIPTLLHLSIGKVSIAYPHLIQFFKRHSTLNTLDVSRNTLIGVAYLPLSTSKSSFLPLLHTLTATPEYVLPFLQFKQRGHLASLQKLVLLDFKFCNGQDSQQYPQLCDQFHHIYACIALGNGTFHNLTLVMDSLSSSGLVQWLAYSKEDGTTKKNDMRQLPGIQKLAFKNYSSFSPELLEKLHLWNVEDNPPIGMAGGQVSNVSEQEQEDVLGQFLRFACPDLEFLEVGQTILNNPKYC